MRASFVVDTSVLISDPKFFQHYPSSDIILPISVLSELDKLKKGSNETARNARVSIRFLDEISELGDLSTGILLENGALIKVDATSYEVPKELGDPNYADNQILICAHQNSLNNSETTTLLSNDINVRVKARSKGIQAEAHKTSKRTTSEIYSGNQILLNEDAGGALYCNGVIDPNKYDIKLSPHEFAIVKDEKEEDIAIGRLVANDEIKLLKKSYPWKLSPKNDEQAMAIDLIMDSDIDLVTLTGLSGSGKSLIAIASCLDLLINKKKYDKLVIYRPIQPVGNEIGFTPGTEMEKLAPWFQAIFDSFEFLFSGKAKDWQSTLDMYIEKGKIELGAITYIRGRSIPNALILLDEAQNLPADQVKTILTRAGEGSKIILTGDLEQIDNKDLDVMNNGLLHVIEKFRPSYLAGHISLTKGERSRLATEAAKIL